jgi:hypothetical protein
MRLAFLLFLLTTALMANAQSGNAQQSFFNERFCTAGGSGEGGSGTPDCAFQTLEQCVASARGLGRYCVENRFWRGGRPEPTTQGRGRSLRSLDR